MNILLFLDSHQKAEDPSMSAVSAIMVKMPKAFMVLLSRYDLDAYDMRWATEG